MNFAPHGRKIEICRELVEQNLEPFLLATGQISYKESINFSLMPDNLVLYVDHKPEESKKEGMVLLRER